MIEKVFGVNIFDAYSCEGGAVFYECPLHGCYHPSEEYAIQEYIEDSFTLSSPRDLFVILLLIFIISLPRLSDMIPEIT
jgi:phenylacetate-coenzyme A ligase PaaK-like adenylate-forming protein